jgi:Ca2+ transporting ATPase
MLITAVGVNSQTGIIMTLLGATKSEKKEQKEAEKAKVQAEATTITSIQVNGLDSEKKDKDAMPNPVQAAQEANEEGGKTKSVLQGKLSNLAIQIGYIGSVVAAATVIILIVRFCVTAYLVKGRSFEAADVSHFVNFIIIGVTVLVIAVPEGLPLAITLALTYSVKKMMKDNNLVRHLDACETMGNATSICSDKTGTLTTNRMTVVQSYINERFYRETPPQFDQLDENTRSMLIEGISVNGGYSTQIIEATVPGGQRTQLGNKTECALLGFVLDLGQSYADIRKRITEHDLVKV